MKTTCKLSLKVLREAFVARHSGLHILATIFKNIMTIRFRSGLILVMIISFQLGLRRFCFYICILKQL